MNRLFRIGGSSWQLPLPLGLSTYRRTSKLGYRQLLLTTCQERTSTEWSTRVPIMAAIIYLALIIGFIGYPVRTALAVLWFNGFIISFKVQHSTGSVGLATLALFAAWGLMGAAAIAHVRFEQTSWYRLNKAVLENSHLAGIFLGGLTAVGINLLSHQLALRMDRSDALCLGIGYGAAFGAAFVVNVAFAHRARISELRARSGRGVT